MAIDYKKEWEKLQRTTGHCTVVKDNVGTTLGFIMAEQVRSIINKREGLMREYLISGMKTDITGGDKVCHHVDIIFHRDTYTNVKMVKKDFDAWCKKKGGK